MNKERTHVCLFQTMSVWLDAPVTFAVLVWLSETVLIPAGQGRIRRVVVGSVLAVISPQGALRPPLLHGVGLALLQCWPVREEVIAIQIFKYRTLVIF